MKIVLTTVFNTMGIVHSEFISYGQPTNQAYYVEILARLDKLCVRRRLKLAQLMAICRAFCSKIIYCWTGTPSIFTELASQCLLQFSNNYCAP